MRYCSCTKKGEHQGSDNIISSKPSGKIFIYQFFSEGLTLNCLLCMGHLEVSMKALRKPPSKIKWKLHVYYLDACNCDWGCPCQFNANPTHDTCEGLSGIHIIKGNYSNIKLNGLNMAF